jgi:hypothetical protein
MADKSCETRIDAELESTIDTIRKLWTAYCEGDEERHSDDLGTFHEYGLSFDYVPLDTFNDQTEGYFRYQISWGGPSDEFRFFTDAAGHLSRTEYWFLDWFDGASRELSGDNETLMREIFDFFSEIGAAA